MPKILVSDFGYTIWNELNSDSLWENLFCVNQITQLDINFLPFSEQIQNVRLIAQSLVGPHLSYKEVTFFSDY